VIPGLNDHELEAVLEAAAKAGAVSAMFVSLRLPLEIKDLFREWLEAERPDRAKRVMSLIRQMRRGRDYDPDWGTRMRGEGPIADLIAARFARAVAANGLDRPTPPLRTDLFKRPVAQSPQMDLFG
jgi:DNA repair photolyase